MPTPTYTPLANLTLASSAASVTFSSISQAYRDLVLVTTGQSVLANNYMIMRFNSDSGANYPYVAAVGNGSTTQSFSGSGTSIYLFYPAAMSTSSPETLSTAHIMDYSVTDKHKTVLSRGNKASGGVDMVVNRWTNTAAITSIVLSGDAGIFAAGSTFALYGIAS